MINLIKVTQGVSHSLLTTLLASVNLMLYHLFYMFKQDTPWSEQTDNVPEPPCLGCLPSTTLGRSPSPRFTLSVFKYKPTKLDPTLQGYTTVITPRSRCQTTKESPVLQRLLKVFKLDNPKPTYFV